jgi:hypothetical protein
VAREIGADPAFVISATHGKRAIDNLTRFKPHLLSHEMDAAVDKFERSVLFYADAYAKRRLPSSTPPVLSDSDSDSGQGLGSSCTVPSRAPGAATLREQLVAVSGEL